MTSLKTYTAKLAELLGISPAVIYERQRALVKAGLLIYDKGRGPGSGVKVTPESVATLILATLSANNLAETAERTLDVGKARSTKASKELFLDAFVDLLKSRKLAATVHQVTISRSSPDASIFFGRTGLHIAHRFAHGSRRKPSVRIIAEIDGDVVREVADDLAKIVDSEARGMP